MQNLIKNIRAYMNMNQSEFSKRLDVSFATVNRWENGHATPGRQAQEKLYALCGEQKVPMDNMIFAKIRKMAEGCKLRPTAKYYITDQSPEFLDILHRKAADNVILVKGFIWGQIRHRH